MNTKYVFVPRNPNLKHCSDSLLSALKNLQSQTVTEFCIQSVRKVEIKSIWILFQKILKSRNRLSFFLLAAQPAYLVLLFLLKLIKTLLGKEVKVYYLMHEPRLEKGRINPVKAFIIFVHQFLFGYLADVVLLPSEEAAAQAETFVSIDKIRRVNLAFLAVPQTILEKNLHSLKCSWGTRKTFSMLGTVSSLDKNPQGFLNFANTFNQLYPEEAQFIRGGSDRTIQVSYNEDLIIRFPSYLSDRTKSFLFSLSHFIIIPYTFSTQSGVVAEALSYGKILILNDLPAFSHLKNLSFAFFVDFNNESSIKTCIAQLSSMSQEDYESRYWQAVSYFSENHSEAYLQKALDEFWPD